LLLKFAHKLHEPDYLVWKNSFVSQHSDDLAIQHANSFIARIVKAELPRYRSLTLVRIWNGCTTSFWQDSWLLNTTIAETFPTLYMHCIRPEVSHYRKQSLHQELEASGRAKSPALGEARRMRQNKNFGLVEIKQSSVYPGHDVYIVAQQTTQVYYLSYPYKTDKRLQGWSVVYKVSPHGKLPAPGNEDYHLLDPNTYDGDFFQEDGLEGSFFFEMG
jgi:hypothetical protein